MKTEPYIRKKKEGNRKYYIVEWKAPIGNGKYKTIYVQTLGTIWDVCRTYCIDLDQVRNKFPKEKNETASVNDMRQDNNDKNVLKTKQEVQLIEDIRIDAEPSEEELEASLNEVKSKA